MRDRAATHQGLGDLYMAPADLARLGHVMLHQGRWRDAQLLRREYVRKRVDAVAPNPYYGFLYWLNASDHGYTVAFPGARAIETAGCSSRRRPTSTRSWASATADLRDPEPRHGGRAHRRARQYAGQRAAAAHRRLGRVAPRILPQLMKSVKDVRYTDPGPYDWQDGSGLVIDIDHFLWVPPLP
jgi:hypothetical protein